MTSLQQTAMGGGPATAKTANYVLVAADAGTTVAMDAATATTITVDTGLFAAGDTVFIQNLGAGDLTITAGTATVATAGSLILPQNDAGILYFTSASASIFYDYIQVGATSPLTTKGDLYTFGTSDTRLGVGTDGHTLVADSAEATGLKWAAPAGGGKVLQVVSMVYSTEVTTTSTTFQDTNVTANITPSSATSKILIIANINGNVKTGDTGIRHRIMRGATELTLIEASDTFNNANNYSHSGGSGLTYLDAPNTTSATTYKVQFRSNVSGQTAIINFNGYSADSVSSITLLEIGA